MPSQEMLRAREMGKVPDRIWYQVNGKSANENYMEWSRKRGRQFQEEAMKCRQAKKEAEDDEPLNIVIESKVKK